MIMNVVSNSHVVMYLNKERYFEHLMFYVNVIIVKTYIFVSSEMQ